MAERCCDPDGQQVSPDCILRMWGAFAALHGRLSNSGMVKDVAADPGLDELTAALRGEFVRVELAADFGARFLDLMRAALAHTMVLFVAYPPGIQSHLFGAYAAPVPGGGVVMRWIDTQMPGQFERAARPDDTWARLLAHPGLEVLILDPAGYPVDLGTGPAGLGRLAAAVAAAAGSAGPRGNARAAALAWQPGYERPGAGDELARLLPERAHGDPGNCAVAPAARGAAAAAVVKLRPSRRDKILDVLDDTAEGIHERTGGKQAGAPDAGGAAAETGRLADGLCYLVSDGLEKLPGRGVPAAVAGAKAPGQPGARAGAGGLVTPRSASDMALGEGLAVRRVPAGGGGLLAGEPVRGLSERELRARLVAAEAKANAEAKAGMAAGCVAVVRELVRGVYGGARVAGSVDDAGVGLGGVAGVQQRLWPGPGWARVGSWVRLEEEVRRAGVGASALLLVSVAGDRQGHAAMVVHTSDGVRWPGLVGEVRAGPPAKVTGAVAGWALLLGSDGRVVQPGGWAVTDGGQEVVREGWAAPQSASVTGTLADPPLRHDFGAIGVEIERHDICLYGPGGLPVPFNRVLLRSRDGLVKVVADAGRMWVAADGAVYEDLMAGLAVLLELEVREDMVAEIVGVPWAVVEGESHRPGRDAVLARIKDVSRRFDRAPAVRRVTRPGAPREAVRLTDLFPDSEYEITPWFRGVRVVRFPDLYAGAPMLPQLSAGGALGGGVLAGLEATLGDVSIQLGGLSEPAWLGSIRRFGWRVAQLYLAGVTGAAPSLEDVNALAPDWDAVRIAEVMTVAFILVSGVLAAEARFDEPDNIAKNFMSAAARQALYEFWAELGPRLQAFFAGRAGDIRELFEQEYRVRDPDFVREYNSRHGRPADALVDLWQVEFYKVLSRRRIGTVGQLFDEILRPDPDGARIRPNAFEVGNADSGDGPDRSRGPGYLAQFVLELRYYGSSKSSDPLETWMTRYVDRRMMVEDARRLERVVREGNAAAEFALRLSRSAHGRLVVAWLREALTAGPGRAAAAERLRLAARWYLERFPGDRAALGKALGRAAARLGVTLVPVGGAQTGPGTVWPGPEGEAGGGPMVTVWDRPVARRRVVRVRALVGDGALTDLEITRVVNLATSLGMRAGGEKGWLDTLARDVGLYRRNWWIPRGQQLSRLAGLLAVAALVFDRVVGRDELASLRRLVDLAAGARGDRGPQAVLAALQAEYRWLHALEETVPVSMARLRQLVTLAGQALPEGRVTRDQLARQAVEVMVAVRQRRARQHLSGDRRFRLGMAELRDLIVGLLGSAQPRQDPDPATAVELLAWAGAAERHMLLDGEVRQLLKRAVPEGDQLRSQLDDLLAVQTGNQVPRRRGQR
jgi:hypothetical protein